MEFVDANEVVLAVKEQSVRKSIETARESLSLFRQAFVTRKHSMSNFVVSGFIVENEKWLPVGLLVQAVEGDRYIGTRLDNDRKPPSNEEMELEESKIVDWYYVDLWEMQGGYVWKAAFSCLSKPQQTGAIWALANVCQLEPPVHQTPEDRRLLSAILNDSADLPSLLQNRSLSDAIWYSYLSPSGSTGHGKTSLQNVIVSRGDLPTIARLNECHRLTLDGDDPPPCHAALYGRLDVVKYFINTGLSINTKDGMGQTPLKCATSFNHIETALWLIANGAEVNCQDIAGRTPLHVAKDLVLVKALLEAGANPSIKTYSKNYPESSIESQIKERRLGIVEFFANRSLISENVVNEVRAAKALTEQGKESILGNPNRSHANEDRISFDFSAGRVLPFDFLEFKTGNIGFFK